MWVDIANLIGPRGKDGEPGPPGPVNIGLRPDDPIEYNPGGGFTFNLVDGSYQNVNIPIASAQSAGLLGAGGQMPTTGARDISDLLTNFVSGAAMVIRSGPLVTLQLDSIKFPSSAAGGWTSILSLPAGFRPPFIMKRALEGAAVNRTATLYTSGSLYLHREGSHDLRMTWTYSTPDQWPAILPGTTL